MEHDVVRIRIIDTQKHPAHESQWMLLLADLGELLRRLVVLKYNPYVIDFLNKRIFRDVNDRFI